MLETTDQRRMTIPCPLFCFWSVILCYFANLPGFDLSELSRFEPSFLMTVPKLCMHIWIFAWLTKHVTNTVLSGSLKEVKRLINYNLCMLLSQQTPCTLYYHVRLYCGKRLWQHIAIRSNFHPNFYVSQIEVKIAV